MEHSIICPAWHDCTCDAVGTGCAIIGTAFGAKATGCLATGNGRLIEGFNIWQVHTGGACCQTNPGCPPCTLTTKASAEPNILPETCSAYVQHHPRTKLQTSDNCRWWAHEHRLHGAASGCVSRHGHCSTVGLHEVGGHHRCLTADEHALRR